MEKGVFRPAKQSSGRQGIASPGQERRVRNDSSIVKLLCENPEFSLQGF
jgi:hypothetical protein